MTMQETVLGHSLSIAERLAGTTIYMGAAGQPALARLTGGKQWLKMDLNRALGTLGFSGLPTQTTDPLAVRRIPARGQRQDDPRRCRNRRRAPRPRTTTR